MYRGSAHILLGNWIDANDHMHIENHAVDEKQCLLFCKRLMGGGYTPFCHPPFVGDATCFEVGYILVESIAK